MQVPGFRIKRTIGRGGMATVYLAVQESLQREVVLKTMNRAKGEGKDFIERFLNEGRIIASLQHPHIVTVFDIGTIDHTVWIAMEYVGGGDLKARLETGVEPSDAIKLVLHVAQALGYAHARGIIHRDVKPANILFRTDGTVLLSDFGIAKRIQADSELTSTGTILGSPFYMSPEQAEGRSVDTRTDIYSLGVILFEMLAGQRPYRGDTAIKVIMQHVQAPVPSLPAAVAEYQPLVERMMAKSPDDRIPDAETLVKELQRHQAREVNLEFTADFRRPRRPESAISRLLRRYRWLAALVVAAGTASAGFLGAYLYAQTLGPSLIPRQAPPPVTAQSAIRETSNPRASGDVAAPERKVAKEEVVRALEWLARHSLKEDRLTQPPADNALYYFSRLLALDPQNETARRGFADIAERYIVLAEKEFSNRNYDKAQVYIALGLQVDPNNQGLLDLRSFIENRERSFIDTVLGLFRS
ncbi:MAG: serine/threonine protein kinase [Gammaproteobacteria bacterium]|nr:serine/threonine protein kinase [Gammaproteobacteria bacterium]